MLFRQTGFSASLLHRLIKLLKPSFKSQAWECNPFKKPARLDWEKKKTMVVSELKGARAPLTSWSAWEMGHPIFFCSTSDMLLPALGRGWCPWKAHRCCLLAQQQEGCWSAAVSTLQPLPKSLPLPSVLYEGKSSVAAGTAQSWWLSFMEEQEMAGVPPPAGRGSIWMGKVRSHTIPCCTALEESSKGAIKCCATIVPLDTPTADVHLPCTCGKQLHSWFPGFLLPTKLLLPMGRLEKPKSSAEAVRRQRATPQASYLQREKSKSCSLKRLQDAGVVERGSLHRTAQQQAALGNSAHGTGMFLITPALNRLQDCKLLDTLCPLNWPSAEGLQEKSYGTELQPPDSRVFR